MSIIDKFLEDAGGNFLNVKNCPSGTVLTITAVYRDDDTFDSSAIICTGKSSIDNEETNARLSASNVKRILESLGSDDTKWVGQEIQCIGHMDYPGLNAKGLLWGGVVQTATPAAPVETVKSIIVKIMAGTDMKAKAIKDLIDKEVVEAEDLLDELSCAQIVADRLLNKE